MAFCTNCGTELPAGVKFCTECGTKVPEPVNQEPARQPVQAPASPVQGMYPPFAGVDTGNADSRVKTGEPGFTMKNGGQKKNTGLFVGITLGVIALVSALLLVLANMLPSAGQSDDSGVLGRYEGVCCNVGGVEMDTDDEWVELKAGGKVKLRLLGDTYTGTWALDGGSLTITESGDEYSGTLRDGVMIVDFFGMTYTFAREGVQVPETAPQTAGTEGEPVSTAQWWEGDWYGWWILQNGTGTWESFKGSYWDTCARIWVEDDGTGYIELWDKDCGEGERFAYSTLDFLTGGISEGPGCMVSREGAFWDQEMPDGAWVVYPDDSPMGPAVDRAICILGTYEDPDDSGDTFDYEIYLRPWGLEWEDVRGADTSEMPYDDMMPAYYDSWYLPLIRAGVTEAPDIVGE